MAISNPTVVTAATGGSTGNLSAYNTGATVLTAGRLYRITVSYYRSGGGLTPTSVVHDPDGTPLNFTLAAAGGTNAERNNYDAAAHRHVSVWWVIPGSTTASAGIRITFSAGGSACCWITTEIVSGFNATTPVAEVQVGSGTASTAVSVATFAGFGTDALTTLDVGWGDGTANPTETIAPTEGRSELTEQGDAERTKCAAHYQNPHDSDTTVGATLSANVDWGAIGIEWAAADTSTTVTPSAVAAAFAVVAPTLIKGALTKTPAAIAAVLSVTTPTVINVKTLTPTPVVMVASVASPTVQIGVRTLTPDSVTGVWSIATPTVVKGGLTKTPTPVVATFAVTTPTLSQGTNLQPSPDTAVWSVAAPTVVRGALTTTPTPIIATWSVATPSVVQGGGVITPQPVPAAFSVPAPTVVRGALTKAPTPIGATFAVAVPTVVRGTRTIVPSPAGAAWGVAAANPVLGPRTLTPSAVVGAFAPVNPTVIAGTLATFGRPPFGALVTSTSTRLTGLLDPATVAAIAGATRAGVDHG